MTTRTTRPPPVERPEVRCEVCGDTGVRRSRFNTYNFVPCTACDAYAEPAEEPPSE